ncbi:MAG: dTDP-4-dehydrorhamnose reductase [Parcubacteria group bacterium GW2011_GWA2_52_8]|nr:MAG: dTDP-4-dehydrorhamnose reductase [Parcubacteria group bacterium GW2011_GWA2_52_8]
MKVLIIGAKGMLGQALVREFSDGNEVLGWDREQIDITVEQDLRLKIQDLRPELIINAAAYNDVDGAENDPAAAKAVNGYAVGNLARVSSELDVPLIHFSTDYVFDGAKKHGYDENADPLPISAYGESKFLGEQQLATNAARYYLIRLSRLFGAEAAAPGAKKSFVRVMRDLAGKREELEVVDEELSCPTYAPDLAKRTREIVASKAPFGIYHCPNSGETTWYGFAQEIFKVLKMDVRLKAVAASRFPRPAKRPAYSILLNTKLEPMRPWQEALSEFLISNS